MLEVKDFQNFGDENAETRQHEFLNVCWQL